MTPAFLSRSSRGGSGVRKIQRALWFIGGFDSRILETEACRSVRAKYSCVGGLVLMTSLLAVCSGGYALSTVFKNPITSVPLAILWGCFIFAVDRFLVTSNRKLATSREFYSTLHTTPPYTERHSVTGVGGLVVRLLLSAAIGIVVAKPIEMAILEPWATEHEEAKDRANKERRITESDLGKIDAEITRLEKAVDARQNELERGREKLSREVGGERASGMIGKGIIFRTEEELLAKAQQAYSRDSAFLVAAYRRRESEKQMVETAAANEQEGRLLRKSFISDLRSVHEIKKEGGPSADLVAMVSLFLTCFFVIIEITPILAKVVSPFDPYDAMLLKEEHESILNGLGEARRSHQKARASAIET